MGYDHAAARTAHVTAFRTLGPLGRQQLVQQLVVLAVRLVKVQVFLLILAVRDRGWICGLGRAPVAAAGLRAPR